MDNQHKLIKGYRDLSQLEIDNMNAVKAQGQALEQMLIDVESIPGVDIRWVSIARTHLQQGLMAAVRSIAQPTTF